MTRVALIDADVLCYQSAYANTLAVDWDQDGDVSEYTDSERALQSIPRFVEDILKRTKCSEAILVLSDRKQNFRKQLCPTYKENRSAKPKPKLWSVLRDAIENSDHGFDTLWYPRLEGDDVLGILATGPDLKDRSVVVTIDKDLQTIPCNLFLFNKPELGVRPISELDAARFHLSQVLTGDTVDNYKGLPGVGPKKAAFLDDMDDPEEMWSEITRMYEKKELTEQDALLQARLAYILRHGDYKPATSKIKLWHPRRLANVIT